MLAGAGVAAVAFVVWEKFANTRLDRPGGRAHSGRSSRPRRVVRTRCRADGHAGQRRTVRPGRARQRNQNEAVLLLVWFLGALPVGRAHRRLSSPRRIGDRIVAFVGLLIAAFAYWLVSHWTVDVLTARHDLGLFTVPIVRHRPGDRRCRPRPGHRTADVGDAARRSRRATRHRVGGGRGGADDRHAHRGRLVVAHGASTASISILPSLPKPGNDSSLAERLAATAGNFQRAYSMQYGEIVLHHHDRVRRGCSARIAHRRPPRACGWTGATR